MVWEPPNFLSSYLPKSYVFIELKILSKVEKLPMGKIIQEVYYK